MRIAYICVSLVGSTRGGWPVDTFKGALSTLEDDLRHIDFELATAQGDSFRLEVDAGFG